MLLALAHRGESTGPEGPPAEITELPWGLALAETDALQAANEFGLDLLRRLYAEREDDGNCCSVRRTGPGLTITSPASDILADGPP